MLVNMRFFFHFMECAATLSNSVEAPFSIQVLSELVLRIMAAAAGYFAFEPMGGKNGLPF